MKTTTIIGVIIVSLAVVFTLAWGLPVVGRVDTFDNGTTQGWGGSYSTLTPLPMHIPGGGPAGPNDPYMEISTNRFHLATRNMSRAWTGDYLSVGVKAISMDLNHLRGNSDVRLRLMLFGPGGTFATALRTEPLNEHQGWFRHTFHLGIFDMIHVAGGTGVLEDTLSNVTTVLVRHDAAIPAPPGQHPPHIRAAVGIDNIQAVLREYDVAWEFDSQDTDAYVLAEVEPSHIPLGEIDAANPTLDLVKGQRYQIALYDPGTHPIELIAKGASPDEDLLLLSMSPGVFGTFEDDEDVDWLDQGDGTVAFTLTSDLWAAMQGQDHQSPGYRSALHPETMRGDFVITE